MKRAFAGILFSSVLATAALHAADAVTLAAQQEAEERYKNLVSRIDEMQAAQTSLEKRISALAADFSKLRDEVGRNNNNTATQESIRELNKQILKVDESRVKDNQRIQEALEKLGNLIRSTPAAPPSRPPRVESGGSGTSPGSNPGGRSTTQSGNAVEDGFDYVIQSGDRLDRIVTRYREEKIMVTKNAIMAANPTVDWSKLKVGQHIFIPKPK